MVAHDGPQPGAPHRDPWRQHAAAGGSHAAPTHDAPNPSPPTHEAAPRAHRSQTAHVHAHLFQDDAAHGGGLGHATPEQLTYFVQVFQYYVDKAGSREPALDRKTVGVGPLDAALEQVASALELMQKRNDLDQAWQNQAFSRWGHARATVTAALAQLGGAHPELTAGAQHALTVLDARTVQHATDATITGGASKVGIDSPSEGFRAHELAEVAIAAADRVTALLGAVTAKQHEGEAGKGEHEKGEHEKGEHGKGEHGKKEGPHEGEVNATGNAAVVAMLGTAIPRHAKLLAYVARLRGLMHEIGEHHDVARAHDIAELANLTLETSREVAGTLLEVAKHTASHLALPRLAESLGKAAERLEGLETLEKVGKGLGIGVGILQIVSGAIDLVKSVRKGNEEGAIAAGHEIAQGAWAVTAAVAGLPLGITAGIGGTIFLFYEGVEIMGQLGGILRDIDHQALREEVGALVNEGEDVAQQGRYMASAFQGFVQRQAAAQASGAGGDPLGEQLSMSLKQASDEHRANLKKGMRNLKMRLYGGKIAQHPDVAAKLGAAMRAFEGGATTEDPLLLGQECSTVFRGLDRMGRYVAERYGHAPGTEHGGPEK
jgi:hypothetical protein